MLNHIWGRVKGAVGGGGGGAVGDVAGETREAGAGAGGGTGADADALSQLPRAQRAHSTDGGVSAARRGRIERLLASKAVDVAALRDASWAGLPDDLRPDVWRILLGYAPPAAERRPAALARKRREYADWLPTTFGAPGADLDRSEEEEATYKQIGLDVPRTAAGAPFVAHPRLQQSLHRCLYVWAMRHPASGYVQGINDLATPFLAVFLEERLRENAAAGSASAARGGEGARRDYFFFGRTASEDDGGEGDAEGGGTAAEQSEQPPAQDDGGLQLGPDAPETPSSARRVEGAVAAAVSALPEALLLAAEADVYWCLCEMLDRIHDHYTFAQPGIQVKCDSLAELVARLEPRAAANIEEQGLQFLQFAFRWFNCLLIREVPFCCAPRLWDAYLAEGDDFPDFLIYVAAALLLTFSSEVCTMEFQDLVMFIQSLPTKEWDVADLDMVLSRAFMCRATAQLPAVGPT